MHGPEWVLEWSRLLERAENDDLPSEGDTEMGVVLDGLPLRPAANGG